MPLVRRHSRACAATIRGDWSFNCKSSVYVWTEEDYAALNRTAAELGASPEDLLLVLELESGRNPHRAFCNKKGYPNAVGLNQITSANSKAMAAGVVGQAERKPATTTVAESVTCRPLW